MLKIRIKVVMYVQFCFDIASVGIIIKARLKKYSIYTLNLIQQSKTRLDLEHQVSVDEWRLSKYGTLDVMMQNMLSNKTRLWWQIVSGQLNAPDMIGEFHLAPSHFQTLITRFTTKLDASDPWSQTLLCIGINAFLLDLAQLRSQSRHLASHAPAAILLNGQVELLLEVIVQGGVE